MWICGIICVVLVLGTGIIGVIRIRELKNIINIKESKIVEIQKENYRLIEEYSDNKKELGKLEKAIGEYEKKLKEYESKGMSVPVIDTSKKTYMDYRIIL